MKCLGKSEKTDRRYGKRTKMVTARITFEDAEVLSKNGISISNAIEEYIDNNLNLYARQEYRLRQKMKELEEIEEMESRKPELMKEIEELQESIRHHEEMFNGD